LATHAVDDDELSGRLGIHLRQTVNQAARKLEPEGLISRVSGPDGKLVNVLDDGAGVSTPVVVERASKPRRSRRLPPTLSNHLTRTGVDRSSVSARGFVDARRRFSWKASDTHGTLGAW